MQCAGGATDRRAHGIECRRSPQRGAGHRGHRSTACRRLRLSGAVQSRRSSRRSATRSSSSRS
jgi:hypothetical protein